MKGQLPEDLQENKTLFPDDETTENCEVNTLTDKETNDLLNDLWKELKAN